MFVKSIKDRDIDIEKVKIIPGKGLRIDSVHPSDEGTYVCEASNLVSILLFLFVHSQLKTVLRGKLNIVTVRIFTVGTKEILGCFANKGNIFML